jgi:uncharacterized repeat protein (TIGR02543 family)
VLNVAGTIKDIFQSDDRPATITGPTTITGTYQTSYLVHYVATGNANPITVPLDEWVVSGGSATGVFPSPVLNVAGTIKDIFQSDDRPATITGPTTITGTYQTQYYLTVNSDHDTAGGQGWYDSGDIAHATLTDGTVSGGAGVQFVFTGWSVDASGTGLISDDISMSGPKTATANWKTQYYLIVSSAHGITSGEGWYDSSATAYAGVSPLVVSGGSGVQHVFTGWSGDASGTTSPSDPITMDGPKTATADWKTQYQVSFAQTGSAVAPTVTYTADIDPTTAVPFDVWVLADSSISYTYQAIVPGAPGVQYVLTGVDPASPQTVSGPLTITGTYKTQFFYLEHAKEEIKGLRASVTLLYNMIKIGKKEYDHFMGDLGKVEKDIDKAVKNLDTPRVGFDDKMKGFENLRTAVMKLEHMIKDVQDWAKKGKMSAADAAGIIGELETIRMKLVNKARAEALEERKLALKAIADAEALGKDTTKAWEEIAKVDRELAKAEQCVVQGKLAQAIQHFKHAFAHSQHAVKKAYDHTWTVDYKDWIDELEILDP